MVTEQEEALEALNDAIPSGTGWLRATCPFCPSVLGKVDKRRSFGCNSFGYYHCFRCGTAGKLSADDWSPFDDFDGVETHQGEPELDAPVEYIPLWSEPGKSALSLKEARDYLFGRGLGMDTIAAAQIGACTNGKYGSRIIVPILSVDRETWLGFSARDWTNMMELRYRYPPGMQRANIMYQEEVLYKDTDEPAIVVEGVFDALPYFGVAAALLGKPSPWQKETLKKTKRPLAIVLDGDAWEEGWALAQNLRLSGVQAGSVKLPAGEDPNSVDPEWLKKKARECVNGG